ncbi:hypothetical protein HRW23_21865 [Streptomyces lunaelactis]|uniref:hypothetical protein n=1 Tax=Streptomyces lunaelactis TaxID=1535768 RepID=UPI00158484AB|nr:hypothetical protein [Streptomyces lunaelactis]NUK25616.1 hypothetical protein [Streptomyces lunaelactis]NUK36923.1 hypothetical protein [Streptomyces lunaelactis]NUK43546.1 hypothetical protein [Streptomyces lunaelactis]NUK53239.1 hypothetical protein [Streptomyces lunaelactis]NUK64896.1 hypothetical protein [Streptomyces lunaelactis]
MNLRMIGLTAAAVFAALLPPAASAGPADGLWPGSDSSPPEGAKAKAEPRTEPEQGLLPGIGGSEGSDASDDSDVAGAIAPRTAAQCGPELTSPDGVEAQTCVLTEGRDTWARTYYRNATGEELSSVLTLMGPGGRTLQTNCVVGAGDEPDACETPREPSRGAVAEYSAVAEFATADEVGEGPLLLRSGSNSGAPEVR